jgi:hypothetical protein
MSPVYGRTTSFRRCRVRSLVNITPFSLAWHPAEDKLDDAGFVSETHRIALPRKLALPTTAGKSL